MLENALAFWILRAQGELRGVTYRIFREEGVEMTPEQWTVLVRLWELGETSQVRLGEAIFKDKPTTSRIVEGMERRGWVERIADPEDGRGKLVRLSKVGRALEKRLLPYVRKAVAEMERGIPEADLEATRRTLQRIVSNLENH